VSQQEHFARLAPRYDELRRPPRDSPLGEAIARLGQLGGKRVLEIGCGTGNELARLADRHGCTVAGVDPSPAMLERAREKLPEALLRLGTAEELPFAEAEFDGAVMVSVVHHVDRPRALPEARRVVTDGARFVSADMHPDAFCDWWAAPFFPSSVELERERLPHPEEMVRELEEAGFGAAWWRSLPVHRRFSRDVGLTRLRGGAYSTLARLPEAEFQAGLERAKRELPEVIEYVLGWAIVVGER
jgi:ubiquinone/menaquinone biosynthesis C-methylase UbiE